MTAIITHSPSVILSLLLSTTDLLAFIAFQSPLGGASHMIASPSVPIVFWRTSWAFCHPAAVLALPTDGKHSPTSILSHHCNFPDVSQPPSLCTASDKHFIVHLLPSHHIPRPLLPPTSLFLKLLQCSCLSFVETASFQTEIPPHHLLCPHCFSAGFWLPFESPDGEKAPLLHPRFFIPSSHQKLQSLFSLFVSTIAALFE